MNENKPDKKINWRSILNSAVIVTLVGGIFGIVNIYIEKPPTLFEYEVLIKSKDKQKIRNLIKEQKIELIVIKDNNKEGIIKIDEKNYLVFQTKQKLNNENVSIVSTDSAIVKIGSFEISQKVIDLEAALIDNDKVDDSTSIPSNLTKIIYPDPILPEVSSEKKLKTTIKGQVKGGHYQGIAKVLIKTRDGDSTFSDNNGFFTLNLWVKENEIGNLIDLFISKDTLYHQTEASIGGKETVLRFK